MKELLIGMGIGFMIGAITCKTCKPFSNVMEKGKEIVEDIKDEIQSQAKKKRKPKLMKISPDIWRFFIVANSFISNFNLLLVLNVV